MLVEIRGVKEKTVFLRLPIRQSKQANIINVFCFFVFFLWFCLTLPILNIPSKSQSSSPLLNLSIGVAYAHAFLWLRLYKVWLPFDTDCWGCWTKWLPGCWWMLQLSAGMHFDSKWNTYSLSQTCSACCTSVALSVAHRITTWDSDNVINPRRSRQVECTSKEVYFCNLMIRLSWPVDMVSFIISPFPREVAYDWEKKHFILCQKIRLQKETPADFKLS